MQKGGGNGFTYLQNTVFDKTRANVGGSKMEIYVGKMEGDKKALGCEFFKRKALACNGNNEIFQNVYGHCHLFGFFVALRAVLYFPKRQVSTSQVLFDVGNGNKKDKEQTSNQQENKSKQDESQMETIFRKRREILQNFCQIDKWKNRMVVEKGEFHIYNNSKIGTIFCMYYFFLNYELNFFINFTNFRPPKCSSKEVLWSIFNATADFSKDCLAKAKAEIHHSNCATHRIRYNSTKDIFQMAQTNPQFMTFRHPMERLVSVWHGRFQQLNGYTVSFSFVLKILPFSLFFKLGWSSQHNQKGSSKLYKRRFEETQRIPC